MRPLTLLCTLFLYAASASAQTQPVPGVTGTYVPDETVKTEYEGAHGIAAGVGHVVEKAKKLFFGGKGAGQDPLSAFEGRRVVVRDGADSTEGLVIDVNHKRQQITIRLTDRKTETLRLAAPDATPNVVVSYTDDTGAKVARDFTRVP